MAAAVPLEVLLSTIPLMPEPLWNEEDSPGVLASRGLVASSSGTPEQSSGMSALICRGSVAFPTNLLASPRVVLIAPQEHIGLQAARGLGLCGQKSWRVQDKAKEERNLCHAEHLPEGG